MPIIPEIERCIELEIPEKVIKILKADSYIQNLIQRTDMKTKAKEYYIYTQPIQQKTVNGDVALAVFSLGEQEQDEKYQNIFMYRDIFYITVYFQRADMEAAIKGSIKLASRIKKIIGSSLEKHINNLSVKKIYPIKSEMDNSLYTHVLMLVMQTNAHT